MAVLLFGSYILSNILERFDASDLFTKIWFSAFPVVAVLVMVNPWAAGRGLRTERKLQKPILDCVEQYGSRTYDELIRHCMPVKIHLGIDNALERLLREHDWFRMLTSREKPVIACQRGRTESAGGRNFWKKTAKG